MRLLLALLLTSLLGACVSYEYLPPATDQGKTCVAVCTGVREQCYGTEEQKARQEQDRCEIRETSKQTQCLLLAKTDADKATCLKNKGSCYYSANTYRCDSQYDQCFVQCGGRIIEHKK
ncbi:hypothetical protein IGB42_03858 [Andreprevotia sp. IGB-42]|uniref:hypothetical protein n=1 Tax=Andreprevotia sp. IGB-42 TaxID=2497473 RepID=UPI00135C254E|nr:hypothetical protein [Andreprevotia sp. IGB-42]KAF0811700.1 hypothetical protein IGB42_03858 [Andreprevotia sp. IGB-42]